MKLRNPAFLLMLLMAFTLTGIGTAVYSQTAEEILEKVYEVSGYSKNKPQNSIMYMKVKVMGMEIPMTIYTKTPFFKIDQEMMGQKMVMGFDGEKAWQKIGTADANEMAKEQAELMKKQVGASNAADMFGNFEKLEKIGKEKLDDVTVFKIRVYLKDTPEIKEMYMYIDASSYLPVKATTVMEMGEQTMFFKDYRKIGDVTMAHKIEMSVQGMTTEIIIEKVEFNKIIDNTIFKMPK